MFDAHVLASLAKSHRSAFEKLASAEAEMNERFTRAEAAVSALILAVASGEPLLLIGPPGTGKSRLIRAFCAMTGLLDETDPAQDHANYFEYLLTPFTEPSELFGFYDIPKAIKGDLVRMDHGMMQHAKVVYLDEVFNGSSAILNSILAFLNERVFHDRGVRKNVAMECLFAATNHIPETPDLLALFDRFLLRCPIGNVEARGEPIQQLLAKGWLVTYSRFQPGSDLFTLWDELADFREEVRTLTTGGTLKPLPNHPFYKRLAQMVKHVRQYDLSEMSNRRLVKMAYLMMLHRIYESVKQEENGEALELGEAQLQLLPRFILDRTDEEIVQKLERAASY